VRTSYDTSAIFHYTAKRNLAKKNFSVSPQIAYFNNILTTKSLKKSDFHPEIADPSSSLPSALSRNAAQSPARSPTACLSVFCVLRSSFRIALFHDFLAFSKRTSIFLLTFQGVGTHCSVENANVAGKRSEIMIR
jgi:hypothetical protein